MRATKTTAKNSVQKLALLACVLMLSACGKEAVTSAPAAAPQKEVAVVAPAPAVPAVAPKRVVDQLITAETIGMNLAYVDKIAGPAVRSEAHRHLYRVDGCEVTLRSDDADKVVQAVEVAIAPSCQVSLEPLMGSFAGTPPLQLNALTFGKLEQVLGGGYYADCLASCGNAADPVVTLYVEGPRALQLMEFALEAPLVNGPALEAADQWKQAMEKAESEHYVLDNRFNCEPERFRDVAAAAFAPVKPANFVFGRGLDYQEGDCGD